MDGWIDRWMDEWTSTVCKWMNGQTNGQMDN